MIKFNDKEIRKIRFNDVNVTDVRFNDTKVFSSEGYVTVTFPNACAKLNSDNSIGFKTYYNGRNSSSQSAWKAFDNSLDTAYEGTWSSTNQKGGVAIVFPFDINIQSICIVNPTRDPINNKAENVRGINSGKIFVSELEESAWFTNANIYASIAVGANSDIPAYSSTFTNANFTDTNIRSIAIYGDSWGTKATSYKNIGEVRIIFRVLESTLRAWGEQYGVDVNSLIMEKN